jgi:hypothetical protein
MLGKPGIRMGSPFICCFSFLIERAIRRGESKLFSANAETPSLNGWNKIATVCNSTNSTHIQNPLSIQQENLKSYDLSSPREWLEFCEVEKNHGRSDSEPVLAGDPYTVIRCDYSMNKRKWRIWGENFHFGRLKESLCMLLKGEQLAALPSTEAMDSIMARTRRVVADLLVEAENGASSHLSISTTNHSVMVFMVTVVWEVEIFLDSDVEINVRGHGFSSLQVTLVDNGNPNSPIDVRVGHLPSSESTKLPNRYQRCPQAKLSSWCRERRPLESLFKSASIGDVILTRGSANELELLEGLTSNLFVVCHDNVLRTCPCDLVLGGYVRQMILKCAASCGYTVEIGTLRIQDVSTWREVFLTSSIRLIIPVNKILLPTSVAFDGTFESTIMWETPSNRGTADELAVEKLYRYLQHHLSTSM